jgi:hypothetical protein
MATTAAEAQWYGFDVDEHGLVTDVQFGAIPSTLRTQQLDHRCDLEKISAEMSAVEVITLLDGFYDPVKAKPLLPPTCVITKWGFEWIRRALFGDVSVDKFTVDALKTLELEEANPESFLLEHTYTNSHAIEAEGEEATIETITRVKKTVRKGQRTRFASALAKEAYFKFGARPMTEANVLVTRRWLQKLLAEPKYKDLRTCDRIVALDRALFLSFVPTDEFRMMKLATSTRAWEKRTDPKGLLGGLFGKGFILTRTECPDGGVFQ